MTNDWEVYVSSECTGCQEVLAYINLHNIPIEVVNIDQPKKEPSVELMIFPALMSGGRLMAYGEDIIEMLARKLTGS